MWSAGVMEINIMTECFLFYETETGLNMTRHENYISLESELKEKNLTTPRTEWDDVSYWNACEFLVIRGKIVKATPRVVTTWIFS